MVFYIAVIFLFPISFTLLNLYILFSRKYKLAYFMLPLTVVIGSLSYWALLKVTDVGGDWYEAVYETSFHSPISSEHFLGFLIPIALGYLGLAILTYGRNGKKPPLMTALSLASVLVMDVFQVLLAVQMCKNMYTGYTDIVEAFFQSLPMIYHINVIIISMYVFRKQLTSMRDVFKQMSVENKDLSDDTTEEMPRKLKAVYKQIDSMSKYSTLVFVSLFAVIAVAEIICVIAGQGFDAFAKAFTDTADWTFSKQIPPPPLEYEGHYLCTVAAGGHKKIVKPQRYGLRRGAVIIVNRQLCIANAFEDYIQEKFPRFHRFIRHCYDTYGYPVSKLIDTPLKADLVYFVMKPLEWAFLLFLYLFDSRPEMRIKNQYVFK